MCVSGELDHIGSPALEEALQVHLRAGNHRLILDLSSCPYIDSGGLAVIMTTVADLRDDGLLAIVAPDISTRRLLEVVGLYDQKRCAVFRDEPQALSSVMALGNEGALS
jgi:stage II sporulation protein AA (anti-sigma F factor antagonist)